MPGNYKMGENTFCSTLAQPKKHMRLLDKILHYFFYIVLESCIMGL